MKKELKHSLKNFILLVGPIFLVSIIFSFATFVAEYPFNPNFNHNNFIWWWLTTISTVGYGDLVPITSLGKSFASIVVISSILFLAVGISQINSVFMILAKRNEKGLINIHYEDHIVIINYNYYLQELINLIKELFPSKKIVVLNNEANLKVAHATFVQGDPTKIEDLLRAGVSRCYMCILLPKLNCRNPDHYNYVIVEEIEAVRRSVITLVDIYDKAHLDMFKKSNTDMIFSDESLALAITEKSKKFQNLLKKYL
jgi:voltage-gated potassium channel